VDFAFSEAQQRIENLCTKFAAEYIKQRVQLLEDDLSARQALFRDMGKSGLMSLSLSKEFGGDDGGTLGYLLGISAIAKADAGLAVAMAVTNMAAEAIARFGTESQRKNYLSKVAMGECVPLSFALTEKQAGSDPKSIQTSFKEDSEDSNFWLLNGEKQFITNGDIAGALIVFAKDTAHEPQGAISAFLVDRGAPGLKVIKKESKLGLLTANLVSLRFDNCRISKQQLLGKRGGGLKIALSSLDSGRLGIAAQSIGIAEAAFEAALIFSKERRQFGHPIGENQAIAFKLADMCVKLDAAKLLAYRAAWMKDQKQAYTKEASEAKLFCSEICNEIAAEALQIHGGYGYIKDYPVEKYFRDARVTTLYEGTSEIQRIVISRHLH